MSHADAISRGPVWEPEDSMDEIINNCLDVLSVRSERDEIAAMQYAGTRLAEIISILKLFASQSNTSTRGTS